MQKAICPHTAFAMNMMTTLLDFPHWESRVTLAESLKNNVPASNIRTEKPFRFLFLRNVIMSYLIFILVSV